MNRKDLIRKITDLLRENNIKKPVSVPKQVFHISDNDGNYKDFTVKQTDKKVIYTVEDVAAVIEACQSVIEDALKRGEPISIHGFGSLALRYREPRRTKQIGTDKEVEVKGRYVPKFAFGNNLRMCAKVYELSLADRREEPFVENDEYEEADGD